MCRYWVQPFLSDLCRAHLEGERQTCPFRWPGQYEDEETGLYYNRFRYYDADAGQYVSQDPIGLMGRNPTLYGYVKDSNVWTDAFGLTMKNPFEVFYSQSSISSVFSDGSSVRGTIGLLSGNPAAAENIEAIRLVRMRDLPSEIQDRLLLQGSHKDAVFTLDNRRLYAAREAGVRVNTRWATAAELGEINLDRRFSTQNGGKSIRCRYT